MWAFMIQRYVWLLPGLAGKYALVHSTPWGTGGRGAVISRARYQDQFIRTVKQADVLRTRLGPHKYSRVGETRQGTQAGGPSLADQQNPKLASRPFSLLWLLRSFRINPFPGLVADPCVL